MTEPRVLYSAEEIQARVQEVAAAVAEEYRDRQLVLVAMLRMPESSTGAGAPPESTRP